MEKKYFTALIPASDLEMKMKRIQQSSNLYCPFPPICPLEFYEKPILKKEFNKNIDTIDEFSSGKICKSGQWWFIKLPTAELGKVFTPPSDTILPESNFNILIGMDESNNKIPLPDMDKNVIRNWEVAFFELTIWDNHEKLENIELTTMWKVRKRKFKQVSTARLVEGIN